MDKDYIYVPREVMVIMPRVTLAHITFPCTGRGPIRVIPRKEGDGFDVVVANPDGVRAEGDEYGWEDARDVTGVSAEQLAALIESQGEIFDYSNLPPGITPVQEVLPAER